MSKKVVLAFSGGLDTSYCVRYLAQEKGFDVYAVTVNTGGFSPDDLQALEQRARELGVAEFTVLDEVEAYYQECIRFLIFGNVLKNHTYPLSVSAERVFQARAIAQYANRLKADAIAHGSTGAGNDQVRFDMVFRILAPQKEIITPIRDQSLTRQQEIDYLKQAGVSGDWSKALYSINKGLWGTSVGGKETLTSDQYLPDEAFPSALEEKDPVKITLTFTQGEPTALNGKPDAPIQVIESLQQVAAAYAIGRDIHVGDTVIGIKGRVGFEAAAPLLTLKAHQHLEKHTLVKWQMMIKDQLSSYYGNLLHEGHFLDPVMRDIEQFFLSSQLTVSGEVDIMLHPYRYVIQGIRSPYDLMKSNFGQYGEVNTAWSGEDVRGFARILSNQTMIYQQTQKGNES